MQIKNKLFPGAWAWYSVQMKLARGYHPPMWKMVLSAVTEISVMLSIWDGIVVKIRGETNARQIYQLCVPSIYVVNKRTNIVVQSRGKNAKTSTIQKHVVAIQAVRSHRTKTWSFLDFFIHLNILLDYNMSYIIPYQVVSGLIRRPSEGCPEKTTGCYAPGCPATCYCEDHCSWQRCYLSHPPLACLDDIDGYWFRKKKSDPWVAKFHGNSNFIHLDV